MQHNFLENMFPKILHASLPSWDTLNSTFVLLRQIAGPSASSSSWRNFGANYSELIQREARKAFGPGPE